MKTIGVTSLDPWFFLDDTPLMNNLIYFDHVIYEATGLEKVEKFLSGFPSGTTKFNDKLKEISSLKKAGLISEFDEEEFKNKPLDSKPKEYYKNISKSVELSGEYLREIKSKKENKDGDSIKEVAHFLQRFRDCTDLDSRANSILMNSFNEDRYFPIIKSTERNKILTNDNASSNHVLKAVLNSFPVINNANELEKLIEFKSDPDSILKLNRLRNWVLEIGKENYSEKEIHQKIDYLLQEYTYQLEIHKLKHEVGSIEIFLVTTMEIIENVAKLRFSKATKAIFDINKKDIMLLEEEIKFKGNEFALIHQLRKNGL